MSALDDDMKLPESGEWVWKPREFDNNKCFNKFNKQCLLNIFHFIFDKKWMVSESKC